MQSPQLKLEVGSVVKTFQNRKTVKASITEVENGFDAADITFLDPSSTEFSNFTKGAPLNVYVKDATETAWYTMFKGKIRQISEGLGKQGEKLILKCDGAGWPLADTVCLDEFGTQSRNDGIATAQTIINDAVHGLVPAWVNHILGDMTKSSGHNIDTTHVANVGGTIPYLYFGLKPVSKCLCDLIDLAQAYVGLSAGPHWIVWPPNLLMLQTIGAHDAGSVSAGWSNYICGQSAANTISTLTQAMRAVKGEFHEFEFDTLDELANYIVYFSQCLYPANADLCENNVAAWDKYPAATTTLYDATAANEVQQGAYSIKTYSHLAGGWPVSAFIWYPASIDLNIDLTRLGGRYLIPVLSFWFMKDAGFYSAVPLRVWLLSDTSGLATMDFTNMRGFFCDLAVDTDVKDVTHSPWKQYVVPVGPYWMYSKQTNDFVASGATSGWVNWRTGDWTSIKVILFDFAQNAADMFTWLDGLYFSGWILRGAKDGTSIADSAIKLRVRVINDPFAKSDTLYANDDSGTAAQFAKAELLRARTTPTLGRFKTRCVRNAIPGQLLHIHARPNQNDTAYGINRNFRLTKIVKNIDGSAGGTSDWTVTDDVLNAISREAYTNMNTILAAIRPEFQDRQSTGTKLRDIDVTQQIIEKDYFP